MIDILVPNVTGKLAYQLPLFFEPGISEKEFTVSILTKTFNIYFNLNEVELDSEYEINNNPSARSINSYMSCYEINKTKIYFGSFRCVFGSYINQVDNGFPYKFFFVDTSTKKYNNITFDSMNNGVNLYAIER